MNWYAKKSAGGGQGLVIDEETGRNVAVAYDEKDTALLAAGPKLLEALEAIIDIPADDEGNRAIPAGFLNEARAAISDAKNGIDLPASYGDYMKLTDDEKMALFNANKAATAQKGGKA